MISVNIAIKLVFNQWPGVFSNNMLRLVEREEKRACSPVFCYLTADYCSKLPGVFSHETLV